jgi:hypothetical protein
VRHNQDSPTVSSEPREQIEILTSKEGCKMAGLGFRRDSDI